MFDLREFVNRTIAGMIGVEAEYKVRQYATGWLDKGVLTVDDLQIVDDQLAALQAPESEIDNSTIDDVI